LSPNHNDSDIDILIPITTKSELIHPTSQPAEDAGSDLGSDSDSSRPDLTNDDSHPKFEPTIPQSLSGSPSKSMTAPLDPQRLLPGMIFGTLEEALHFAYEYEGRRGYQWRKGESLRTKQGIVH
jgi:hypothetical protein